MSAKKTDISQIRKYLNGELDARAMHQLERKAQDDPFLMDALEGYAGKKDQQTNLEDIQHRLNRRVTQGNKKVMALWPLISIAATVLVVISIGAFWVLVYHPFGQKDALPVTAKVTDLIIAPPVPKMMAPPGKSLPPQALPKAILKPAEAHVATINAAPVIAEADGNAEMRIDEPVGRSDVKQVVEDTAANAKRYAMAARSDIKKMPADSSHALNEVVIVGYTAQRKRDILGSVATVAPSTINTQLEGRVAGVQVKTPTAKDRLYTQMITGKVLSADDNLPLAGAYVAVTGTNKKALTNAQGRFEIQASKADRLNVGYIGYQSKLLNVNNDSLNVALSPQGRSLAEVVVTNTSHPAEIIEEAHPQTGWANFNKYLDRVNAPDGKTGTVKLRFVVNADNSLSGFKIIKSVSPGADAEAIRLVKEGPEWLHNVNGGPETVTLRIKFK